MRNKLLLYSLTIILGLLVVDIHAQSVEILYTKAGMKIAMGFKKTLKAEKLNNFNALALHNISGSRKDAYLKKISHNDAVLIIGETGLKATKSIDFILPLITLDALSESAAVGPIFRVLSAEFDAGNLSNIITVSSSKNVALSANQLKNGSETVFKCGDISEDVLISQILSEIVKNK